MVLGQLPRVSRFQDALEYNSKLAHTVYASHGTSRLPDQFQVILTARPGQSLDALVAAADAILRGSRTRA